MDYLIDLLAGRVLLGVLVSAAAVFALTYRYGHLFGFFSKRSHCIDVGPLTFKLNYLHSLRNPSGRMIFIWTDELGRTYEQTDPRVFVRETAASTISRSFRQEVELTKEQYSDAVKKHVGHGRGWVSVAKTDTYRFPILRSIAFCIVHLQLQPAPRNESVTD